MSSVSCNLNIGKHTCRELANSKHSLKKILRWKTEKNPSSTLFIYWMNVIVVNWYTTSMIFLLTWWRDGLNPSRGVKSLLIDLWMSLFWGPDPKMGTVDLTAPQWIKMINTTKLPHIQFFLTTHSTSETQHFKLRLKNLIFQCNKQCWELTSYMFQDNTIEGKIHYKETSLHPDRLQLFRTK